MTASMPRLRPLLRATALPSWLPYRPARFHAISALYAEEATARRRDIPFLPLFLQPSTYRPSYEKTSSTNNSKGMAIGSKTRNPATFFIWIFICIGSMAIQQIQLKRGHVEFIRKADTRIALLREVLERLGNDEDVDVERILGTGDDKEEMEWEQVLKEIEHDDILWKARQMQKEAAEKIALQQGGTPKEGTDVARPKPRRRARSAEDYNFV